MFHVDSHFVDVPAKEIPRMYADSVIIHNGDFDLGVTFGWNTTTLTKDLLPQFEGLERDQCIRTYSGRITLLFYPVVAMFSSFLL